jgi:murein L,D-transpeptidase YcbB/YkuD
MNGKNYPFFSQYCDGVRVKRANWLSQWGSSSLGEQGYTALQILRYYYGSGINIAWAEQVEGYPYSYPGYTLSQGSCSEDVQIIQNQLNAIRNNYPGIPAISNPNGQYGADTAAAVRTFQSVFGLPVTGVVDYATWYKISYIYVAVKRLAEGDLT